MVRAVRYALMQRVCMSGLVDSVRQMLYGELFHVRLSTYSNLLDTTLLPM